MKYLLSLLLLININGFGQRIDTLRKGSFVVYERYSKDGWLDSIWTNWKSDEPKTDIVKGWIIYYEVFAVAGEPTSVGHYPIVDELDIMKEKAIAIYEHHTEYVSQNTGTYLINLPKKPIEVRELLRIIVNGKEFDLSKWYVFIRDDEIVK